MIQYVRKPKVAQGQSTRIAAALMSQSTIEPEAKKALDFNVKKVSKVAKDIDWLSMNRNFSLDSRKLRRYIVEDVMFANPEIHEQLLLLFLIRHPLFGSTWLARYNAQNSGRLPIQFCNDTYLQIEATVVKNSTCRQFIDGMYCQEGVVSLLTSRGGAGVGLHFPNCNFHLDLEFNFASVIEDCDTLQVWGMTFSGRNFLLPLKKLKDNDSREAYFSRDTFEN
jgi:hypothetical protein